MAGLCFQPFLGMDQVSVSALSILISMKMLCCPTHPACPCAPSHHHLQQASLQHPKFRVCSATGASKRKKQPHGLHVSWGARLQKHPLRCRVGLVGYTSWSSKFWSFIGGPECLLIGPNWFSETPLHLHVPGNTLY